MDHNFWTGWLPLATSVQKGRKKICRFDIIGCELMSLFCRESSRITNTLSIYALVYLDLYDVGLWETTLAEATLCRLLTSVIEAGCVLRSFRSPAQSSTSFTILKCGQAVLTHYLVLSTGMDKDRNEATSAKKTGDSSLEMPNAGDNNERLSYLSQKARSMSLYGSQFLQDARSPTHALFCLSETNPIRVLSKTIVVSKYPLYML